MSFEKPLWDIAEDVTRIFPEYHPDAADINEALDHGVASCAVRAYATGVLARHKFPNPDLYPIDFGWDPAHGGEFRGENGIYTNMGHAVLKVWAPGQPLVIDSNKDAGMDVDEPVTSHMSYVYHDLHKGYRIYLDIADLDDIEFDPENVLELLLNKTKDISTHA